MNARTQKTIGAVTALLLIVRETEAVSLPVAAWSVSASAARARSAQFVPPANVWRNPVATQPPVAAPAPRRAPRTFPPLREMLRAGRPQVGRLANVFLADVTRAFDAGTLACVRAASFAAGRISAYWDALNAESKTKETMRWPSRETPGALARLQAPDRTRFGSEPSRIDLVIREARVATASAAPPKPAPRLIPPRELPRAERPEEPAGPKQKLVLLPSLSGLADLSANQDAEGFRSVKLAENKDVWLTEVRPEPQPPSDPASDR